MRKSRFTEQQIIQILREADAGAGTMELCRRYGIAKQTFSARRAKYGGLGVSEAQRLRELEDEYLATAFPHNPLVARSGHAFSSQEILSRVLRDASAFKPSHQDECCVTQGVSTPPERSPSKRGEPPSRHHERLFTFSTSSGGP